MQIFYLATQNQKSLKYFALLAYFRYVSVSAYA